MKKINLTKEEYQQILKGNCWIISDDTIIEGDAITVNNDTVAFITEIQHISMYVKHLDFFEFKPTNVINLKPKRTYSWEYIRIDEIAKVKEVEFNNLLKIEGPKND